MTDDLFSPLDNRYRKSLPFSLSEAALLQAQIEVEKSWLLALMKEGLCPKMKANELDKILAGVGFKEIEKIEARTQHATRALVESLSSRLEKAGYPKVAAWVHVGLTSFDTVDTAARLRLKKFMTDDYLPALKSLKLTIKKLSLANQKQKSVGRTHGQWAVPTIFGLQFAEAFHRIARIEARVKCDVEGLCGQASGAIGGYQASSLLVKDPIAFEKKFLDSLGLKQHLSSTQIIPPEDILFLSQSIEALSSVVAKVANDLRHLARSEIAEVSEGLSPGQVGSSTMPQKRNPWNLEHVCSLYKVLGSKLRLIECDLVSEHHRDLTNSASSRFYIEFFAIALLMVKRLDTVLSRLEVHSENMATHLRNAGSSVFAEAFYVLATKQGHLAAHDVVRQAARDAEQYKKDLVDVCIEKGVLSRSINREKVISDILAPSAKKIKVIFQDSSAGD